MPNLSDLRPDSRNANKGSQRGTGQLENSLRLYGAGRSILVDRDGNILAGNKTADGAASIGMEDTIVVESDGTKLVVVRRTDLHIDDPKARALAVADNRIAEVNLEWDSAVLAELIGEGVDLSGLWFPEELDALLNPPGVATVESGLLEGVDPDAVPDAVETRCKPGDLWRLGRHRLLCGDNQDVLQFDRLMAGETPVLCLTDPPYGIDASGMTMGSAQSALKREQRLSHGQAWDKDRPDVRPLLESASWQCIFGGNYFSDQLPVTNDWLCWHKNNDNLSFSEFELAWTNYGKQCRHLTHHWGGEKKQHITQKPVAVMAFAIEKCPDTAGAVYDPYCGSGTTIIAAEQAGRECYAMEIDPAYCDIAIARWEAATGKTAELITDDGTTPQSD